jgi:hypothetical protein
VRSCTSKDDRAKGFYFGGRLGATIKELASKGVVNELAHEARKPGSYTWRIQDDKRSAVL